MATNAAKPNGYLQIPFGKEKEFLAPMPVNKIPGVGDHTYESLKAMGIFAIKDISERKIEELEERLGKWGVDLWNKSQGIHNGEVSQYHEAKSVSTENTFDENKIDTIFLMSELVRLTEKIAFELRQDGKVAGCIAVKIRYPDFETTSRQTTIPFTCADDEIIPVAVRTRAGEVMISKDEHPRPDTSLDNLAKQYLLMKEYQAALKMAEKSMAVRGAVLGVSHPSYATSLDTVATLKRARFVEFNVSQSKLTAGIAHNLNNALSVILPNVAECRELATDLVARGECKNAFCAVRPPGHHANATESMGFCIISKNCRA